MIHFFRNVSEGIAWKSIDYNGVHVSYGTYGLWLVNSKGDVWFLHGNINYVVNKHWLLIKDDGDMATVESGPNGLTVGLDNAQRLTIRLGVSEDNPQGTGWLSYDLILQCVTVGNFGIIGILPDGSVIIHKGRKTNK